MKNLPEAASLYRTSDLGIATFLFVLDFKLIKTSLSGPNRLDFFFESTPDIEGRVESFLNGQAQAPARRLFEAYRSLRALAFQKTGNLR